MRPQKEEKEQSLKFNPDMVFYKEAYWLACAYSS
jgi:hypothetical protein